MATKKTVRLILASGSRGRRGLMQKAGYDFEVIPSNVEEPEPESVMDIRRFVHEIAWTKAAAVAKKVSEGIIIAGDTVGWVNGQVIGKPNDEAHAREILKFLGGKTHELWTGAVLWRKPDDIQIAWQECSKVNFRQLTDVELDTYIATRTWDGCSGAYAVKEQDDPYVSVVEGTISNVVGFPMETFARVLPLLMAGDL